MKTKLLFPILLLMGSFTIQAQTTEEIKIKTSAECEMCKQRIEKELLLQKGVKTAELDLATKTVTITYKASKTDVDKLRETITNIGYDADNMPAKNKAYEALPNCCKKGEHNKAEHPKDDNHED